MEKRSRIRTVYLYLFSLTGLVLITIGSVGFINLGLRAFIFTKADEYQRTINKQPPYPTVAVDKYQALPAEQKNQKKVTLVLSEQEKTDLDNWFIAYKNWEQEQNQIDYVTSQRQEDAAINLALIIVGTPLYFYHWRTIKKENIT